MSNDFDDFSNDPPPSQHPTHQRVDLGSVDDALSAGVPAAKFETVGTIVTGTIVSAEMAQQRDIATSKPLFWEDGNPRTQILITLATSERSADIDDDDGHRRLYVKRPSNMLKAIAAAIGKTKLSQAVGGTLAIKYVGDGQPSQKGFSKPKMYAAKFTPPNGNPSQTSNQSSGNVTTDTRVAAFKKFKNGFPPGTSNADLKEPWLALIAKVCPGKEQKDIDSIGWIAVQRHLEGYVGEAEMQAIPEDDSIPFDGALAGT